MILGKTDIYIIKIKELKLIENIFLTELGEYTTSKIPPINIEYMLTSKEEYFLVKYLWEILYKLSSTQPINIYITPLFTVKVPFQRVSIKIPQNDIPIEIQPIIFIFSLNIKYATMAVIAGASAFITLKVEGLESKVAILKNTM